MVSAQARRREPTSSPLYDTALPVVYVVIDDASTREALASLIDSAGWEARTFSTAAAFLEFSRTSVPGCLILDVALPDLDGLAVQERIAGGWVKTAVIFVAEQVEVPTVVKAMKGGATEFFVKPLRNDLLLTAIADGIENTRTALARSAEKRMLSDRYESLSTRERQVLGLVVAGRLNKQIADELKISEITVKAHRGNMMRKLKARSVPDLVKMVAKLELVERAEATDGYHVPEERVVVDLSSRAAVRGGAGVPASIAARYLSAQAICSRRQ